MVSATSFLISCGHTSRFHLNYCLISSVPNYIRNVQALKRDSSSRGNRERRHLCLCRIVLKVASPFEIMSYAKPVCQFGNVCSRREQRQRRLTLLGLSFSYTCAAKKQPLSAVGLPSPATFVGGKHESSLAPSIQAFSVVSLSSLIGDHRYCE